MTLYTNSYGPQTEKCKVGTKAVIRPKSGEFFWSANKDIVAVVEEILDGEGVTAIPEGKALLYGQGTSSDFVKSLTVGTEITLNLETNLSSQKGLLTDFKELMGGSDHIILLDGKLIDEQAERHPRTCLGFNKDADKVYLILVDGRWASSVGATMGECAGIFLGLGAWNAVNLDGGGSSCMVVNKEVVNNLSDGKERAVGNGCLLISKAPVDESISQIGFAPRSKNMPIASKIRPIIYGYNQYGLLKSKNLEGVTLTCDPNIGRITDDGYFIASTTVGAGKLTAHYNGAEVSMDILLMPATISLRLNSILLDDVRKYAIEVDGTNGVYKEALDPSIFSWTSSDTQICNVENGVISGLSNGETTIIGEGLGFKGELKVIVEKPTSRAMPIDPDMDMSTWTLTQTGGTKLTGTPLENGMKLSYTGNSVSRGANIKLTKKIKLWGLPDTLRLRINPGDAPITKITISTRANDGGVVYSEVETPKANEMNIIDLPTDSWCDAGDLLNYPVWLNQITFNMGLSKTGTEYTIDIPGLEAIYKSAPSGVNDVLSDNSKGSLYAYPNPINVGESARVEVGNVDSAQITVYTNTGQLVKHATVLVSGGIAELPVNTLPQGTYFIAINGKSVKLVIK